MSTGTMSTSTMSTGTPSSLAGATLGILATLGTLLIAVGLNAFNGDAYYRAVQEDELLEWCTFWAFLVAAALYGLAARRERRTAGTMPWFFLGVSLFCFVVAMEEISWGQRIFGYQPPTYFLANNYQQEFNFHNVVDTDHRKRALKLVLLGFGVFLPVLMRLHPALTHRLHRLGLRGPHPALIVTFVAAYLTYQFYWWRFTGEWVEMVAGCGFLFAGYLHSLALRPSSRRAGGPWLHAAAPALVALALAMVTTVAWRQERRVDPRRAEAARAEVAALYQDFQTGNLALRCGLHRRLYTYMESNRQPYLAEGRFAALVHQGLPEARARFLLDPWNSPYWLRHRCDDATGREVVFVYSFGPNRRRDSTPWELLGDDVGTYIVNRP